MVKDRPLRHKHSKQLTLHDFINLPQLGYDYNGFRECKKRGFWGVYEPFPIFVERCKKFVDEYKEYLCSGKGTSENYYILADYLRTVEEINYLDDVLEYINSSIGDGPPFSPESLFDKRKVKKEIDEGILEGIIFKRGDHLIMKLGTKYRGAARRAIIAHELGHTFSMLKDEYFLDIRIEEEMFADKLGREILMPSFHFDKTLSKIKDINIEKLFSLARMYKVPMDWLVQQICDKKYKELDFEIYLKPPIFDKFKELFGCFKSGKFLEEKDPLLKDSELEKLSNEAREYSEKFNQTTILCDKNDNYNIEMASNINADPNYGDNRDIILIKPRS